jgi:hypothetical protein
MKMIKLFFRFVISVTKSVLKLILVFIVIALIFGVQASLVITFLLTVILGLIFINNLFAVLTEGRPCHQKHNKVKQYDPIDGDPWTPGSPAVTQKAFINGFFNEPKL